MERKKKRWEEEAPSKTRERHIRPTTLERWAQLNNDQRKTEDEPSIRRRPCPPVSFVWIDDGSSGTLHRLGRWRRLMLLGAGCGGLLLVFAGIGRLGRAGGVRLGSTGARWRSRRVTAFTSMVGLRRGPECLPKKLCQ